MLPTGMLSLTLIWACGAGRSSASRAISCRQQRRQAGERLAQRGVPLGGEQLLLRCRRAFVGDVWAAQDPAPILVTGQVGHQAKPEAGLEAEAEIEM